MRRSLRRISAALLIAAPLTLTTGCLGLGGPGVEVSGGFGVRPDVSIPKGDEPGDSLEVSTLTEGDGATVGEGDLIVADYAGYRWNKSGSRLIASSFVAGRPGAFPSGKLVPGLEKALRGKKAGSRVLAVIPPADGYGDKGAPALQIGAGDSLVYVVDVVASYPAGAAAKGREQPLRHPRLPEVAATGDGQPRITMPRKAPPRTLQVRTLIAGTGPQVTKGQLVALHYAGAFWRDGKVFDSSWATGQPYAATLGLGQVVKGWDEGLVGHRIGSRMLLVVPPKWGYGAKGLKQSGIKGGDTLVFVVDLLGAH